MYCGLIHGSLASAFCPPLCAISPSRSSPFWCMPNMISDPPTKFPSINNCRNVGPVVEFFCFSLWARDVPESLYHGEGHLDWQCTEATHWRLRETLHVDEEWCSPWYPAQKICCYSEEMTARHGTLISFRSCLANWPLVFKICGILLYFHGLLDVQWNESGGDNPSPWLAL